LGDEDLNSRARIRNAALIGFAEQGVAATSIRWVARQARVSPGLVQHLFPTKDALRDAVNEYVVSVAAESFRGLPTTGTPSAVMENFGNRITDFVRGHPTELRYVARAIADGDEDAIRIFDAFVAIAESQWQRVADAGLLVPDADIRWAVLHTIVMNLGTVLFEPAISRHLPAPFFSPEQLERWNLASQRLFRNGYYRLDPDTGESASEPADES
jgi:AcrR family transcriptional regulator